jgi:hypothetical protein
MKLNYQHVLKFHLNQKNQNYLKNLNYEMFLKDQLHRLYPRMLSYRLRQTYQMSQKKQRLQNCQMILNDPSYQHCQKRQM